MAQMSAASIATSGVSGGDLATFTNSAASALNSGNKGVSRPAHLGAGGLWTKTVTGGDELYEYNGTADILIGKLNNTGPAFELAGTTAFSRSLMDDVNAAAARATLGCAIEPLVSDVVTSASLSQIIIEIPTGFSGFMLDVQEFLPSTNDATLKLQVGTGTVGSPTWQTSYSEIANSSLAAGDATAVATVTSVGLTAGTSSNATFSNSYHIRVTGMRSSGPANIFSAGGGVNGAGNLTVSRVHAQQTTNATRTVTRLIPSAGTISGVRYQIFGVRAF